MVSISAPQTRHPRESALASRTPIQKVGCSAANAVSRAGMRPDRAAIVGGSNLSDAVGDQRVAARQGQRRADQKRSRCVYLLWEAKRRSPGATVRPRRVRTVVLPNVKWDRAVSTDHPFTLSSRCS